MVPPLPPLAARGPAQWKNFARQIVAAPKVYGFDTGFVCAHRGWTSLRRDDLGHLWEHYVLNELTAHLQSTSLRYWRDKQGHHVDLIWLPHGKNPVAIECKLSARDFDPANLLVFARLYPKATLLVTTPPRPPRLHPQIQRPRSAFPHPRSSR